MNEINHNKETGFTLLELLIVIAIIAILAASVVFVLNPTEMLRRSRDVQRMSDLATLKAAIGVYATTVASPSFDGLTSSSANTSCGSHIYYSASSGSVTISGSPAPDGKSPEQVATSSLYQADGTGWLPVNFSAIAGGSPISSLPVDPINTVGATPASTDLVYRYACKSSPLTYEIDAQLESQQYTVTEDKRASDGGNNSELYEVGTNLTALGTGTAF